MRPATVTSKVETITPAMAEEYLNANTHNRPLNNKHVARLIDQMKRGLWKLNGDSIGWDINGVLVDGQHRLWACVESGCSFETLVVRGLPLDAFETKGVLQKARSNADIFAIAGETSAHKVAAALQWLNRMRFDEMEGNKVWPASELMEALAVHPGIREYVKLVPGGRWLPHSMFVALSYCFGRVDREGVEAMLTGLRNGFSLGTPFHLLRERMLANATGKAKVNHTYIAALAIKAWNSEQAGKPVHTLRWQLGVEKFPKIERLKLK